MTISSDSTANDVAIIQELRERLLCLSDFIETCAEVNYWRIPLALEQKIKNARESIAKAAKHTSSCKSISP